ncbi:MAG TPA: HRDC domain-containing protein, partial [Planctomycetaceae bacterium]|nr:HRDC domain-containing protein [Planctomycetaceae bacterium]
LNRRPRSTRTVFFHVGVVPHMPDSLIDNQQDFESLCEHIREAGLVAFDSEFVSENSYNPELCLMQFATEDRCVAVDPLEIDDLSSWWNIMADESITVVVHGGQAEIRFCLVEGGVKPNNLYDIQIAEAFRGRSYPLSYTNIVSRVLRKTLQGKETRTDWKRRPLLPKQAKYALEDVIHVLPIWKIQRADLERRGRLTWAEDEFRHTIDGIADDLASPGWMKLSGLHRLGRRELAVAREVYNWREKIARERNKPPRVILRDDLILELARRQPKNESELLVTRDMEQSRFRRYLGEMVEAVRIARGLSESELPERISSHRQDNSQDDHVIGKLLSLALANLCSERNIAMSMIATNSTLREFVRWSLEGRPAAQVPELASGWRQEVCGNLLTEVLEGKISLRVADPESDHPLVFERSDEHAEPAVNQVPNSRNQKKSSQKSRKPRSRNS